jgi:RNA polymerase sigma-70 factor (ECF subfamily)
LAEEAVTVIDDPLASVVEQCRQGRDLAWRQLYDACHAPVYRLAARMVGEEDAADVTQQTFLQAFRGMPQFDGRSKFQTWMHRLAVNESLQHLRRKHRHPSQSLDHPPADNRNDANDVDHRDALAYALGRIDPQLRAIFHLREVEGLSYREIAEVVHLPEGTVASRLSRARHELRQHLGLHAPK